MNNRNLWIGIVVLIALGGGWYLFCPERLFVNDTVAEALPSGSMSAEMAAAPTTPMMVEEMPAGAPVVLRSGTFHTGSHETSGTATVYRLADGSRVLRFTGFKTSNGPDVQVYMVAASDVKDNDTVTRAGFVAIAALKGNQGDQNYELPADLDLGKYQSVTIWCRRFAVNFGTAPLTAANS